MSGNGGKRGNGQGGVWTEELDRAIESEPETGQKREPDWYQEEMQGEEEEDSDGYMGSRQTRGRKREREGAWRIMEALSGVDAALLERSDAAPRRKRPVWQYGRAWAAVICVAIVGVLTWRSYQFMGGTDGANSGAQNSNNAGGAIQMSSAAVSGLESDGDSASIAEILLEEDNSMEEKESLPSNAASGTENQGGTSPSVAPNGNGNQEGTSPSVAPNGNGNQEGDKLTESCGVPLNTAEKLTEEEARHKELFGVYIPTKIPEGYGFETAHWYEEDRKLSIGWSRGLDYIQLSMEQTQGCDTIDINVSERYDVRFYEIPYGETVPQEYWRDFDDPVFAWEDFSLEIIESRMCSYEDSGDTNTPRGNFSILFPDGMLMRFRGKGTVEQIWEMFQSLGL